MFSQAQTQTLDSLCEFINGGAWCEEEYVEEGLPVLKVSNFKDNQFSLDEVSFLSHKSAKKYAKHQLSKNDLIIATVGSHPNLVNSAAGRTIRVNGDTIGYYLNQNAVYLKTRNSKILNQVYLAYLGQTEEFKNYIQVRGKGAASQMRIAIGDIKSFPVKLIPIEAQEKIASILLSYDDLIENNLKRIKLLEEMAQITYEEWFVRMKYPGHEVAVFDEETELPKGWQNKKISDIGNVVTGKTPSTSNEDFYGSKVPFIKTPDIAKAPYILNTEQSLSEIGAQSQSNKFLPKNSLVVSCIGTAGEFGLVSGPSQTNQQINAIKFKNSNYAFYMYCFAKKLKPLLEALGSNGATMTNVSKSKFEAIDVVIPNEQLLQKFNITAKNSFESILMIQKQNKLLKEAREILLPRLMTGMINIEQLELPEAMLSRLETLEDTVATAV